MRDNFDVHEWKLDQIRKENKSVFDGVSVKDFSLELASEIQPWLANDVDPTQSDLQMTMQAILGQLLYKELKEDIDKKIDSIVLTYTNYGTLYSIEINGEKQRSFESQEKAKELIKKLSGKEVPENALYISDDVQELLDALKAEGIDADSYEMDVD
tara:strand:- start:257 stop:724 length:468 start_codon:yes stop_codon:yes gene_type:complete